MGSMVHPMYFRPSYANVRHLIAILCNPMPSYAILFHLMSSYICHLMPIYDISTNSISFCSYLIPIFISTFNLFLSPFSPFVNVLPFLPFLSVILNDYYQTEMHSWHIMYHVEVYPKINKFHCTSFYLLQFQKNFGLPYTVYELQVQYL